MMLRTHASLPLTLTAALFAAVLASSSGGARADAVDVAFAKDGLLLSGREAAAAATITIREDEELTSPVVLALDWQASELIKLESSTLSVRVDETPVRSLRLSQVVTREHQGSMQVTIGTLAPGFHRVSIEAHLDAPGEPCRAEHERETWLRVHDSSRVRYTRKNAPAVAVAIAQLTDHWASTKKREVALSDIGGGMVSTKERALANLEADFALRKLGVAPTYDVTKTENAWFLATVSDPSVDQAPWDALGAALAEIDATQAIAQLIGGRLYMLARTDAALRDAVRAFAEPSVRALCDATECRFGAQAPSATAASPAAASSGLTVLRLGDSGFPHGFLARGLGDHTLRFGWERPASYAVRGWPTLHLELRLPDDDGLEHSASHVRVELNDTPIASYGLEKVGSNVSRLEVRIPEEHWNDPYWAFTVHARLVSSAGVPCAQVDSERYWLVIGAASSLDVPRNEPGPTGLARLYRQSKQALPVLAWNGPLDGGSLAVLGAVAFGLREQRPWEPLHVAASASECSPFCFGIASPDALKAAGVVLRGSERPVWDNARGQAPLLDAASALYLVRTTEQGRDRLAIALAANGRAAIEPPQLSGMHGDQAVFHAGRWTSLPGTQDLAQRIDVRAPEAAVTTPPARTPEEQTRLHRLDLAWSLALIASIAGLFVFMTRRAKHLRSTS